MQWKALFLSAVSISIANASPRLQRRQGDLVIKPPPTCSPTTVTVTASSVCKSPPIRVSTKTVVKTIIRTVTPMPPSCPGTTSAPDTTALPTTYGELCPHYCVQTEYAGLEHCPVCLFVCTIPPKTTVTETNTCKWCPTMSCGELKTTTVTTRCPKCECPGTSTAVVDCPYETQPPGYQITIG